MWPAVNDKLIEIEFIDAIFFRGTIKITEDEKQSLANITKAKISIYNENFLKYEPFFPEILEVFREECAEQ